ncbi:MAG TPA: MFS transporter, partial [Plasticicumulans sp.]|nr:MFS transporter [Plasticicumulans sp.]
MVPVLGLHGGRPRRRGGRDGRCDRTPCPGHPLIDHAPPAAGLTVALPALRKDLAADYALLQWVMNGYVLALAALTLIGGALSDRYGHAKVLAAGCLLFALASAGCALAPDIGWLIATRVLQGI